MDRISLYHLMRSSSLLPCNLGKVWAGVPLITLALICSAKSSFAVDAYDALVAWSAVTDEVDCVIRVECCARG